MLSDNYRRYYLSTDSVFPSVFALKFFLGRNPGHDSRDIENLKNADILDVGFGDGRDLALYASLGMNVFGVEIDEEVVLHTQEKFRGIIPEQNLKVGTNRDTGFDPHLFDYVTAFATLPYLENETVSIDSVLTHIRTLLKKPNSNSKGGYLFCTLARHGTHVLRGARSVDSNTFVLDDPFYKFRQGQRYYAFSEPEQVENRFQLNGLSCDAIHAYEVDWFGTLERLFIVKAHAIAPE